ncbi:UDP-N-acetylmuramate dehydrogenase [Thiofaba sp. EF100]|uniref:UDP-N-acetylmuramate dehydrogenase n=1 Tax=Thiofaba sp. EF100 TaxID=3121274 RepID=UPI00322148BC
MHLEQHASLLAYNTFRVEARARYFLTLEQLADIPAFLGDARLQGLPRLILGGGSNILFRADFPGMVVRVALRGLELLGEDDSHRFVRAAAGENWHDFVRWTVEQGWPGLENLSLIPGTVGAAPVQNIGAYGVELAEVCAAVEAVDLTTGEFHRFDRAACRFTYRDSLFKQQTGRWLITAVTFRLPKTFTPRLDYPGVREALGEVEPTPLAVSDAICSVRRAKLPGLAPGEPGSAGSFFKNPLVPAGQAEVLRASYPGLPAWPQPDGRAKLSAAWLIEQCGWKGCREGDAGVYAKHALVLVNHGRATGAELWRLAEAIRASVRQRFGVDLEPEPILLP